MSRPVGIAGFGHFVPKRVIPNEYFTRFVETSDEWIVQRTGIKERRWLEDGEKPSEMFAAAAIKAMDRSGVKPEEIDLIILGTVSGDMFLPATACIVQNLLGCVNASAFDISAACPGFLYSLIIGQQFITSGQCNNVLCIGGEALSRIIDIHDRNSCVIFGDGAGACVLQPHDICQQGLIDDVYMGADGSGWDFIHRPRGGAAERMTSEILTEGSHLIRLKGKEVYRFAVAKMEEIIAWASEGIDPDDICLVIPHQVNRRILETATAKIGIDPDKVLINIERYGNTSAASIPILMSEAQSDNRFIKGKYLILAAFGAGLVWAGARVKW